MKDQTQQSAGDIYVARMHAAAAFIRDKVGAIPPTLLILGSGLGALAESIQHNFKVPYQDIPHMPITATPGHVGNLIIGSLDGNPVAALQGRVHCHDGLTPQEVAFSARVMAHLGVSTVVVTNAAGGINPNFNVGDVMVINGMLTLFLPQDPAFGISHPELGPKFYPVSHPFDNALGERFRLSAGKNGITCHAGGYAFVPGPRYETATDIRFLAAFNKPGTTPIVDAVGMSIVPEVIALKQMRGDKIRILGLSVITNIAAGLSDQEPNDAEVQDEGAKITKKLAATIRAMGTLA